MPVSTTPETNRIARFFGPTRPAAVGVAVSGGSDSLAVMLLASDWARAQGVALHVATVDHGLRDEAGQEINHVKALCAGLGLSHDTLEWRDWNGQGNLQAEARRARYGLLADWGRRLNLEVILIGHTQDDQAETFLLRLMRKSGVEGLAAMQQRFVRHGQPFGRPVLDATREELRAFLRSRHVDWCDDASNDDARFDRVRAREALGQLAPLGLTSESLSEVARHLASARDALDHFTRASARDCCRLEQGDVVIARPPFLSLPGEVTHRILGSALRWVSGADYPPRAGELATLRAKLSEDGKMTLSGCLVSAKRDVIRVTREAGALRDLCSDQPVWDRWQISGPWQEGMTVRALGAADLAGLPDWREAGLPRTSLLASPTVCLGDTVLAAPLAGLTQGFSADLLPDRAVFPLLEE